jgi:membrane protein
MKPRDIWTLTKESFGSWKKDYAPSMGAALSYYTLFSLAPLLIIIIAVAGMVFGAEAVRGQIFSQLGGLIGADGAKAVEDLVAHSAEHEDKGIIATVIGTITLLLGATTVLGELQTDLDRIWRAPPAKASGVWGFVRTKILSFGLILGVGFLLLVSLVVSAGLSALQDLWAGAFGEMIALMTAVNFLVSFVIITGLFAMIYKLLPRVKIAWRDVWIGSAVTALLFVLGKFAIGLYLGKSDVSTAFGAAGSIVILLVWVYYAAQIFLLGAEFTRVYAERFGSLRGRPREETSEGEAVPAAARA